MFSDNLKLIRKEKGLTQEEVAAKLHVVRQTVSKWEKGVSVPDADLLLRLSEILETPVATLLGAVLESSTDINIIGQQLEQLNATLAEKNRRGRFILRVIMITLISSIVIYMAIIIIGLVAYHELAITEQVVIEVETEQMLIETEQ